MKLTIEEISPQAAQKYLESNRSSQRNVKETWVRQLAKMMEKGQFDGLNGDTIKFTRNGKGWVLIDGQHRLNAIERFGKPVQMCVLRGVEDSGFWTYDQGYSRNVENFYQIANQSHAKIASQVAKWLYYSVHGGSPLSWRGKQEDHPLPGAVAEWGLQNHPDLPDVLARITDYLNQFQKKGLGTKAHLAFCYYVWQIDDPIDAYEIAKYLATGEGDVCRTVKALREYLMAEAKRDIAKAIPGTIRGSKIINAMNRCWNLIHKENKKNLKTFKRQVASFDAKVEKRRGFGGIGCELCL